MERICGISIDDYIHKLTDFHGNFAPGLLVGGFMVDIAIKNVRQYEFFDAICETSACLPDAIQILTPCTVGNGWLKIVNTGRFALSLYDKKSGNGIRVNLDASKLDSYPEIKNWFLRLTTKHEQDKNALIREIISAGENIYTLRNVAVSPELLKKNKDNKIVLCRACGEAYPGKDGGTCPACRGMYPYRSAS